MLTPSQASSAMTLLLFAPELAGVHHLKDKSCLLEGLLGKKRQYMKLLFFPWQNRVKE